MLLPGGIYLDGALRGDFRFRPVTGELELMLGESAQYADNHALRISIVLSQALETLGGVPASVETVRQLSAGDRQFLMARLAAHISDQPVWVTAYCQHCQEPFDISYRYMDAPVKTAGASYPRTQVATSLGLVTVHAPTGADQERVANARDHTEAMSVLLRCLIESVDIDAEFNPDNLSASDIAAIEQQVEAMAPEIATELLAQCPLCGADNTVAINLYACLARPMDELFAEVHIIASHYHWSEQAILNMTRRRRHTYLRHIDSSRGMNTSVDFMQVN